MKCPRCLTVCTREDTRCLGCGAQFVENVAAMTPAVREKRAAWWALAALAVGTGLGPIVGDNITIIPRTPGGPNVNMILWACLGGGIGAVIGYALALARFRSERPAAALPEPVKNRT